MQRAAAVRDAAGDPRCPHPDELVSGLTSLLASPLEDPFAAEVVSVPTRGIERWLTQRIASEFAGLGVGDGICANVSFPSPRRLVGDVVRSIPALVRTADAWDRSSVTPHVLAVIDELSGEPWLALLDRHIAGPDGTQGTAPDRLAAAAKLTRLYDTYARRRPEMVRSWADAGDTGPDGAPLPPGRRWQAELWRAVRRRIDVPSFPEVLPSGLDPIRTGGVDVDLPDRVAVYGLTAIDPIDLDVLVALAAQREVHLFVLSPSPALWAATSEIVAGAHARPLLRSDDRLAGVAEHALLRSWAQESTELCAVLALRRLEPAAGDAHLGRAAGSMLGRLQEDVRANRRPGFDPALAAAVADGGDRSIQVHACHGDRRQVEVLRDAILHVLAADPTLEPRDIVVMTPDLAMFAPLLEGAFPSGDAAVAGEDGLPDLRLRIADRSPSATNPLVRFAATVSSSPNRGSRPGRFETW